MCCSSSFNEDQGAAAEDGSGDGGKKPPYSNYTAAEVAAELRELAANAVPLMAAGLLLYPRGMISMYFLGRLGKLELAGGSLSIAFANITGYSVLYGLSLGIEPICGQAYGAGQRHLVGVAARRAAACLLLASLPIALLWLHIHRLLLLLRQDPGVAAVAHSYLLHSLPDLPLLCFLHPLRIFLRSQSITTPLFASAAAALPVHFLATAFLARVGGAAGVALASVCTNAYLLLLLLLYLRFFFFHGKQPQPRSAGGGGDSSAAAGWASIVRLALPSCALVCLEWWWYELMILVAGILPDAKEAVAAMGILIQVTAFLYIFPSSLGMAVATRVSNELGAGRPERARLAVAVAAGWAVAMGVAAAGAAGGFLRNRWGRIFSGDEGVVGMAAAALPLIGMCELGNNPQTAGSGVLRGCGRARVGVAINLGCFYGVGLPVALAAVFWAGFGFLGIWVGLLAAQMACALSMLLVVARTNWHDHHHYYVQTQTQQPPQDHRAQLLLLSSSHSKSNPIPNNNSLAIHVHSNLFGSGSSSSLHSVSGSASNSGSDSDNAHTLYPNDDDNEDHTLPFLPKPSPSTLPPPPPLHQTIIIHKPETSSNPLMIHHDN